MTQIHIVEQLFADPAITVAHTEYNTRAVDLVRAENAARKIYEDICHHITEARSAKSSLRRMEEQEQPLGLLFPRSNVGFRLQGSPHRLLAAVADKLETAMELRNTYRATVRTVRETRASLGDDPSAGHEPIVSEKVIMYMLRQNNIDLPHLQEVGPMSVREQAQDIPETQTVLLRFLNNKFRVYLHFPQPDRVTVLVMASNGQTAGCLLSAADELNRQTDGDDKYLPDNYPGSFVFTTTNLIEALTRLDVLLKQATNEANY